MIIVRSPLRISLGGGGTDLPSYYRRFGGIVLAAAIDKYVYITVHDTFEQEIIVKYSHLERVGSVAEIEHPLVREALRMFNHDRTNIEITSMADIPAGTGLGSSGSFLTALLQALHARERTIAHAGEIAAQACAIEIDRLGEPVGKQDQYISAYGGVCNFAFNRDETVSVAPLNISRRNLYDLEDSLLLFFTGFSRKASSLLQDQDQRCKVGDKEMEDNLHYVKELGLQSRSALEGGRLTEFGELLHTHWLNKKKRSGGMSNNQIDTWYDTARANGAIGGKVVGAGGGGCLLLYVEDRSRVRQAMSDAGLQELRFRFDFEGTKLLAQ